VVRSGMAPTTTSRTRSVVGSFHSSLTSADPSRVAVSTIGTRGFCGGVETAQVVLRLPGSLASRRGSGVRRRDRRRRAPVVTGRSRWPGALGRKRELPPGRLHLRVGAGRASSCSPSAMPRSRCWAPSWRSRSRRRPLRVACGEEAHA
jgi:hypothetical protein